MTRFAARLIPRCKLCVFGNNKLSRVVWSPHPKLGGGKGAQGLPIDGQKMGGRAKVAALNQPLNDTARNTDDVGRARQLVTDGADLLSTNGEPWRHTPLHQASFHGRYEMAACLVDLCREHGVLERVLTMPSNPCGRGAHGHRSHHSHGAHSAPTAPRRNVNLTTFLRQRQQEVWAELASLGDVDVERRPQRVVRGPPRTQVPRCRRRRNPAASYPPRMRAPLGKARKRGGNGKRNP